MSTLIFKDVIDYQTNSNNEHINIAGGKLVITTKNEGQVTILLQPPLPPQLDEEITND